MPLPSRIIAGFALLLIPVAALHAQDDHRRSNNWLGVGLAAGSAGMGCVGCRDGRETSIAGHVRFGITVGGRAQLGAEISMWKRWEDAFDEDIRLLAANLRLFPGVLHGIWLQAGFGFSEYTATHEEEGGFEATVQTRGWTVLGGIGYAFRIQPGYSIDPYLSYARQLSGKLELSGAPSTDRARVDLIQLGIGITWYRGRD